MLNLLLSHWEFLFSLGLLPLRFQRRCSPRSGSITLAADYWTVQITRHGDERQLSVETTLPSAMRCLLALFLRGATNRPNSGP